MATVNALSVALFNAAAGGYAAEMTANASGFANSVGPILEKDVSTDALFVDHLLGNLGVTSTNAVYAQAKTAVAALVTTKGRAGAATDAVDFLKAQEGTTSAYAAIAEAFAAKVAKATAYTTANATERDITKLVSGVTGVDTDAAAIAAAVAAAEATAKAAADAAAAKAAADLAAANAAAEAAATKAAADLAAANAAAKAEADAAAAKAAAELTAVKAELEALKNPAGEAFALTTSTDTITTTKGNDVVTGTAATYSNNDQVVDFTSTDSDVYNLTVSASATPNALNIEAVNVTTTTVDGTNPQITASSLSGVKNLTITGGDVVVGGANITGDDDIDVTGLNASKVEKITAGVSTGNITVVQSTKAGVVIDGGDATGSVAVTGSATLTANTAVSTVAFTALSDTTEDAKPITANVALASSVTTAAGFTGAITINAAKASTITVNNATGGATVTGGSTSTADTTITVGNIDSTGASITTGTGYDDSVVTTRKEIAINLDGTSAATDVVSVSAAGFILLDANTTDLVETVNLSGNGADVNYVMVSSAPTTYNITGNNGVTVTQTAANLSGVTLTDNSTAGTSTVEVTSVATADVSDLGADVILLTDDGTNAVITAKNGQNIQIGSDQTTSIEFAGKEANAVINLATSDDTGADGTTVDLSVGSFVADTYVKTLNLVATEGKFTATDVTLDIAGTDATTLNISGTKQVTLGTTTAKTINAASLEAKLDMTLADAVVNTLTAATITGGSGNDAIVLNDDDIKVTLEAGAGNNTITITAAAAATSVGTGSGNDTVTVTDVSSMVVVTGAGTDNVKISHNADADVIAIGGDGTDTLTFLDTSGNDFSDNANFAFSAFENVNIAASATGNIKINSTQFRTAGEFTLIGTASGTDTLEVVGKDTTGATADSINASSVTLSDAYLQLDGGLGADTISGSTGDDVIVGSTGSDTLFGDSGSDTVTYATIATDAGNDALETGTQAGVVVNLSSSAIAATTILARASLYTASSLTSVAANTAVYTYAAASSSNASTVDTLSSIENITGSAGPDYLIGSATANTITTGDGADYVDGGLGEDTIVLTDDSAADKVIVGSSASSVDTITGFTTAEDILDLSAVLTAVTLTIGAQINASGAADAATAIALVDTAADTDAEVYYILNTATGTGYLTLTQIETAITAGSAATGQVTVIIENADGTYIYTDDAAQTDAGAGAGLVLRASLTGVALVATGDLISV